MMDLLKKRREKKRETLDFGGNPSPIVYLIHILFFYFPL